MHLHLRGPARANQDDVSVIEPEGLSRSNHQPSGTGDSPVDDVHTSEAEPAQVGHDSLGSLARTDDDCVSACDQRQFVPHDGDRG